MKAETNYSKLIQQMSPRLNEGEYVFASVQSLDGVNLNDVLCTFREKEGVTLILTKAKADTFFLAYENVFSWISLEVHSSLEAVGLTSAFSGELAKYGIACNVVAGYYHDHIFVLKKDTSNALKVLEEMGA